MCYDDKAMPPTPPGASGPAKGEDIVLISRDGTEFAAFYAGPTGDTHNAQVLIYPDVRGLHNFYKELALRFAEVGYPALALDYFGRTAGLTPRDDSFEFMPHVQQLQLDSFFSDVSTCRGYLRDKNPARGIFVVGFCMGGSLALISGTQRDFEFKGLIPFYAGMTRNFGGQGTLLDFADRVQYPVLGLFGGADQGIPESDVRKLEEKLNTAGVENEIVIYPGAPHSFFDRRAADYAEASADAWQRILAFIQAKA